MKNLVMAVAMVLAGCAASAGKTGDVGPAGPQGPQGATGALAPISCPSGQYVKAIDAAGNPTCAVDQNTTYTNGQGLLLNGNTFSLDSNAVQKPVTGSCPSGSAIRSINGDGSVSCGPFTTTVYVPGNGSASANGAALLAALSALPASGAFTVKLEPGSYDVGSALMTLAPQVELSGTSSTSTTIISSAGPAVRGLGGNAIRDLAISNAVPASGATFNFVATGGAVSHVVMSVSCPQDGQCVGVQADGALSVDNVQITMTSPGSPQIMTGINSNKSLTLRNSSVSVSSSGPTQGLCLFVGGGVAHTIDGATCSTVSAGTTGQGISGSVSSLTLRNSTVTASGHALDVFGTTLIQNSQLTSTADQAVINAGGTMQIVGGSIQGVQTVVVNGVTHVVGTILQGGTANAGTLTCNNVVSTNGTTYTTMASTCP
jgi:hypothetical protein